MHLCLLSNGAAAPCISRRNGFSFPQRCDCLLMRLFSLKKSFQGCVPHLQAHAVVLLKKNPFQGCVPHLRAHAVVLLKKNLFQGCVSHLFLPYLVLSSSSLCAENGSNSSKVFLPMFGSPSIFFLSSVRPFHVLEMEESATKSSFPLSDHPQSFLCMSSVKPLHVLEMEESAAESSFPFLDHPQFFSVIHQTSS